MSRDSINSSILNGQASQNSEHSLTARTRLMLDTPGMGKHIQQRRRIVIILLTFLPVSIFILLCFSPPRIFTRSLDPYVISNIPWIGNSDNNNNSYEPCWEAAPALYHCFRGSAPRSSNKTLRPASNMEALMVPAQSWHPSHCIDDFFVNGKPCSADHLTTLDVVWTWVNGSDALFQRALWEAADFTTQTRKNTVLSKLYR